MNGPSCLDSTRIVDWSQLDLTRRKEVDHPGRYRMAIEYSRVTLLLPTPGKLTPRCMICPQKQDLYAQAYDDFMMATQGRCDMQASARAGITQPVVQFPPKCTLAPLAMQASRGGSFSHAMGAWSNDECSPWSMQASREGHVAPNFSIQPSLEAWPCPSLDQLMAEPSSGKPFGQPAVAAWSEQMWTAPTRRAFPGSEALQPNVGEAPKTRHLQHAMTASPVERLMQPSASDSWSIGATSPDMQSSPGSALGQTDYSRNRPNLIEHGQDHPLSDWTELDFFGQTDGFNMSQGYTDVRAGKQTMTEADTGFEDGMPCPGLPIPGHGQRSSLEQVCHHPGLTSQTYESSDCYPVGLPTGGQGTHTPSAMLPLRPFGSAGQSVRAKCKVKPRLDDCIGVSPPGRLRGDSTSSLHDGNVNLQTENSSNGYSWGLASGNDAFLPLTSEPGPSRVSKDVSCACCRFTTPIALTCEPPAALPDWSETWEIGQGSTSAQWLVLTESRDSHVDHSPFCGCSIPLRAVDEPSEEETRTVSWLDESPWSFSDAEWISTPSFSSASSSRPDAASFSQQSIHSRAIVPPHARDLTPQINRLNAGKATPGVPTRKSMLSKRSPGPELRFKTRYVFRRCTSRRGG